MNSDPLANHVPRRDNWEYQERANYDTAVMREEFRQRLYRSAGGSSEREARSPMDDSFPEPGVLTTGEDPTEDNPVALANALYQEFRTACFWHCKRDFVVTEESIPFIVRGLRENGGRRGFLMAARLERTMKTIWNLNAGDTVYNNRDPEQRPLVYLGRRCRRIDEQRDEWKFKVRLPDGRDYELTEDLMALEPRVGRQEQEPMHKKRIRLT